jgi:hypothetical protein
VRANARTIGSASSGGTERANSDCQTLFEYLWGADANLTVSTGRGVSANADWVANKTIALPDWRGRALAALDDMGNSAAGRLTNTYFGTAATALGAAGGNQAFTLTNTNLPPYTPSGSVGSTLGGSFTKGIFINGGSTPPAVAIGGASSGGQAGDASVTSTFTGTAQGGTSTPFPVIMPAMLATIYLKL